MKKCIVFALVLFLAGGVLFADGDETEVADPHFAASFILSSILPFTAPLGGSVEMFFGNLGVGASLSGLFLMVQDVAVFTYEPGVFARLYLGDLDSCFFLTGGAMYWSFGGASGGEVSLFEDNVAILKVNAGIGYNALFGKEKDVKFSIELGPRYLMGKTDTGWQGSGIVLMHFMMSFGKAF